MSEYGTDGSESIPEEKSESIEVEIQEEGGATDTIVVSGGIRLPKIGVGNGQ